jgi:polysaccharide export outer membrane protein
MIRPDGKITMPFLGDVAAASFTPLELSTAIKERLKKYIVDPDVSVSVSAVNSKRYYIQGEVNKTGEYKLLVPTKVLEALVNAGGFKDFANQKKIVIMRVSGERLNFNYKEVIRGKNMDQNIYLKPGDIIIVK